MTPPRRHAPWRTMLARRTAHEFALTEFGLGRPYTLVLTGWPAGSCDQLRIELPC